MVRSSSDEGVALREVACDGTAAKLTGEALSDLLSMVQRGLSIKMKRGNMGKLTRWSSTAFAAPWRLAVAASLILLLRLACNSSKGPPMIQKLQEGVTSSSLARGAP
jgi:hypothetical protein